MQLLLLISSIGFLSDDLARYRVIEFGQSIGDEYASYKRLTRTSLVAEYIKDIQQKSCHSIPAQHSDSEDTKEAGFYTGKANFLSKQRIDAMENDLHLCALIDC